MSTFPCTPSGSRRSNNTVGFGGGRILSGAGTLCSCWERQMTIDLDDDALANTSLEADEPDGISLDSLADLP